MSYKKILILLGSLLFLLTALTFYLNRVVFPQLIKKFAVEQLEHTLKRRVVIDTIQFNWFKGFVINNIKIYEKESPRIFAQAHQVSFGLVVIPGFKHYHITIPFIHVHAPLVHLIRTAPDIWNFSDLLSLSAKIHQPHSPSITWGGLTISQGQCLLQDASSARLWSELFDHINLKFSLFYKGVNYEFSADIPKKDGSMKAVVEYQPLSQNTHAHIELKNIDTSSYLPFFNRPDVHLTSGMIKTMNLELDYAPDKTSASGDMLMTDLDLTHDTQTLKGTLEIHGLNAQYSQGHIKGHGQLILSRITAKVPGLSLQGSLQSKADDFQFTPAGGVVFHGELHAQTLKLDGENRHPSLQGDFTVKSLDVAIHDENHLTIAGDLQGNNVSGRLDDKNFISQRVRLDALQLTLAGAQNITLTTKMLLDHAAMTLGQTRQLSGTFKVDPFTLQLKDDLLDVSMAMSTDGGSFVWGQHKTLNANPHLELTLQMPLKNKSPMTWQGSVIFSDAAIEGLPLAQHIDHVALDADFKTDMATINALSVDVFKTHVQMHGTVTDFKNPVIHISAQVNEFDLANIKTIVPSLLVPYGLDFEGSSLLNIQFDGLLLDPLAGHFQAAASLNHAGITSRPWHQKINNINGSLTASEDSLSWADCTATFLGESYSTAGTIEHFKEPEILAILNGKNLHLKADMTKINNRLIIHHVTGKFLDAAFDSKGTIIFTKKQGPLLDLTSHASVDLQDLIKALPAQQTKNILDLHPTGIVNIDASLKGMGLNWKNYTADTNISSAVLRLKGYGLNDLKINVHQNEGKIQNLRLDGKLYDGALHAVFAMDLMKTGMPYDLALNIDGADVHKLKMDSPLKMEEINGKLYLTAIANGTMADFKNKLTAHGSIAIKEGYLGQFSFFKGLLGILNEALRLGEIMITDMEDNFTIDHQEIMTDNLRLHGPTLVLLGKGWVHFDQTCNLDMTVDLSSGVVPDIAHDILGTIDIRIYNKISNPKYKQRISMPQVLNSLLGKLWQ